MGRRLQAAVRGYAVDAAHCQGLLQRYRQPDWQAFDPPKQLLAAPNRS